jgi:hypothetical protein
LVLEKIRMVFPRLNALYLNTKGTKDELNLQKIVERTKIQETDSGLSGKRVMEDIKANATGFSKHDYDKEADFDGNGASYSDGHNSTPWKQRKYSRGGGRVGRGKSDRGTQPLDCTLHPV